MRRMHKYLIFFIFANVWRMNFQMAHNNICTAVEHAASKITRTILVQYLKVFWYGVKLNIERYVVCIIAGN